MKYVSDKVKKLTTKTYDLRRMLLLTFLIIIILVIAQQFLTREHDESLYLKTQLKPGSLIFWDGGFDGIIPDYFAEPRISANDFAFSVWNDATLSLALFANPDKSLKCRQNQIGDNQIHEDFGKITVPTYIPNILSHYIRIYSTPSISYSKTPIPTIYSKTPVSIKLGLNTNLGAIAFDQHGIDGIDFSYYKYLKNIKSIPIYTFGDITGKEDSSFSVLTADSKNKEECTGKFHAFKGKLLPMLPPEYIGNGAEGILKLVLRSKAKTIEPLSEGIFLKNR